MDAGVTIALGTDGASSNDTLRIFDVMRVAALIHSATGPDSFALAHGSTDILRAATIGGAYSAMLEEETGSLEVGKQADLIVLRTDTLAFTPMNDVRKHLVYCGEWSSLELVMVNGEVVLRDGKLTQIDEDEILARSARSHRRPISRGIARVEERNRALEPYFAEIHRRATLQRHRAQSLRRRLCPPGGRQPRVTLNRACRRRRD